ncbi:hypothetical protein amrb99_97760 [Actinomadura sp. RB99]|uniref:hypothetical protein n=1 Tax=Actinomadura sp. RB99 TaxID=2691577 RepID=UPI0016823814|nr:hypothetical protein [Actinomadura sp. RB99]MBD2900767.1 hypothetical protein [Actinomadura sp. RB99]
MDDAFDDEFDDDAPVTDALVRAVTDQLAEWGLDHAPEGAAALDLARRIGRPKTTAPAAAMLHGQLRALLSDLRKLAPPKVEKDGVAELQAEYQGLRIVGGGS